MMRLIFLEMKVTSNRINFLFLTKHLLHASDEFKLNLKTSFVSISVVGRNGGPSAALARAQKSAIRSWKVKLYSRRNLPFAYASIFVSCTESRSEN